MKQTKHILLTLAALLCSLVVSAHDFEVDGIYYGITSSTDLTVKVTYKGYQSNNSYSGVVTIPSTVAYNGKTYSVTSIGNYAFRDCSSLTAITIPESVTSIGDYVFKGCSSLTAITIPEGVTSIGNEAFKGCSSLTAITIPEGVKSIGDYAFYGCTGELVVNCNIPSASSSSYGAFFGSEFTKVIIGEGVTSIGDGAFAWCSSLTSINIPEGVKSIGDYAFSNCSNLTAIVVAAGNTIYDSRENCNAIIKTRINQLVVGCSTTIIPESVTSIGDCAFYGCSLTAITLPESVKSIGDEAFAYCSSLTSITIPESVTSIGDCAFYGCTGELVVNCKIPSASSSSYGAFYGSKFTKVIIGEGVTSIGDYAFYGCSLTSINIPEGVTSIGGCAFQGCSSLTSITIPEGVTSIGYYAFSGCSSLTSITIPEGVTRIGDHAFYNCSSLTSITIPEGVTWIGDYAFYGCSLTSITLPESVAIIRRYAFSGCSNLTSITIPESVTEIGDYAFYGCSSLTSITIPEGVTWIGEGAFSACSELLDVYCYAEKVPSTKTDAFNGSYPEYATLHVPVKVIQGYKSTAPWSSFGNIVTIGDMVTINQYGSGTYSSKYALDFSRVEGLKAYAAAGYNKKTGVVTLLRVNTTQPGTGIFLKGEPGKKYEVPIIEESDDNVMNMLVGTLTETSVNGTSPDGLYANYKYTIKEGDAEPKFYQFADGSSLGAGKAYLQIPTAWLPAAEQKSISIRFDEGEGTTDMGNSELTIDNSQLTIIYDLYGRRVAQPVKGSMYIVGGRKVVY